MSEKVKQLSEEISQLVEIQKSINAKTDSLKNATQEQLKQYSENDKLLEKLRYDRSMDRANL
jgi:DNA polymerase III alpha subunit (gram-positive type)